MVGLTCLTPANKHLDLPDRRESGSTRLPHCMASLCWSPGRWGDLRPYSVLLSCFRILAGECSPEYTLILAGGCSPDFLRHSVSFYSLESDPNLETQPISWIFVDNTTSFVSYCPCSLNGDNSVMTSFDGRKMSFGAP